MKCSKCSSALVIGLDRCIVCNQAFTSRKSIPYKYFFWAFWGLFIILELTKGIQPFGDLVRGFFVSVLSAIVFGAITWLFYEIFGKIIKK